MGLDPLVAGQPPSIDQAGLDVFAFEPRIAGENGLQRIAGRQHAEDVLHRQTVAADDRLSAKDPRRHRQSDTGGGLAGLSPRCWATLSYFGAISQETWALAETESSPPSTGTVFAATVLSSRNTGPPPPSLALTLRTRTRRTPAASAMSSALRLASAIAATIALSTSACRSSISKLMEPAWFAPAVTALSTTAPVLSISRTTRR